LGVCPPPPTSAEPPLVPRCTAKCQFIRRDLCTQRGLTGAVNWPIIGRSCEVCPKAERIFSSTLEARRRATSEQPLKHCVAPSVDASSINANGTADAVYFPQRPGHRVLSPAKCMPIVPLTPSPRPPIARAGESRSL